MLGCFVMGTSIDVSKIDICKLNSSVFKRREVLGYDLLNEIISILDDKSLIVPNTTDIIDTRRGLTLTEICDILKIKGKNYSREDVSLVLQHLLSSYGYIVRDDFFDKEPVYRYLPSKGEFDNLYGSLKQQCYYTFTDNSIGPKVVLLTADEHIGSDIFNPKLSNNLYDYGIKEGATICVNLGDLLEGLPELVCNEWDYWYNYWVDNETLARNEAEFYRQMNIFINEYPKPSPDEMRTYALMGNHDETMNRFLICRTGSERADLRNLSLYNPSFYMLPRTEWCTKLNGINFHFNHRLYLSEAINDLRINSLDDIIAKENEVGKISQEDYNHIFISGHMHKDFAHSNLNYRENRSNLYLGVPSTSNINVGSVVGYLLYMYPESNSMEVSVLGCDNNLNIFEIDRFSWEFNKINKKCHRVFR